MFVNIREYCESKCDQDCDDEDCYQCTTFAERANLWNEKNFQMNESSVMPIKTRVNNHGIYVMDADSEFLIKKQFDKLLNSKKPHVLIFASCWSYYSQINNTLRRKGVLSVLSLSKDNHDISGGIFFLLNAEQTKLMKLVVKDPGTIWKDFILAGKKAL